jgi:hypothetical protein
MGDAGKNHLTLLCLAVCVTATFKDVLCFSIGLTYLLLTLYSCYLSARYEQYGLPLAGATIMLLRIVVGCLTTLPIPAQFLPSDYDIPPTTVQWAGSAHPELSPFITFFSGHTALIALFATFVRARLGVWWWRGSALFLVVQAMYMFASRGHYAIDVLAGGLIGRTAAGHTPLSLFLFFCFFF